MFTALTAVALLSAPGSAEPMKTAPAVIASDVAAPSEEICIAVRRIRERIFVGHGLKKMQIMLGGGICGSPLLGISDLSLGYASGDGVKDVVEASDCPAYRDQITKLFLSNQQHARGIGKVRVGPVEITGMSNLFDLQHVRGRKWANNWIRETAIM